MRYNTPVLISSSVLLLLFLLTSPYSQAGEYKIENILNIKTEIPAGEGHFWGTNLPEYLGNGLIAFRAEGPEGQEGIYLYRDGSMTKALNQDTEAKGTGSKLQKIENPAAFGRAGFAFVAQNISGAKGIYDYGNGIVSLLLDNTSGNKPDGVELSGFRDLRPAGEKALTFTADIDGDKQALFLLNKDKLSLIASAGTQMPGGEGKFKKLESAEPLGGGAYAFSARGEGKKAGIYIYSGGQISTAADSGMLIRGAEDTFRSVGNPVGTGDGGFIFNARSKDGVGIYRFSGGNLEVVVSPGTVLSGDGDSGSRMTNIGKDPQVSKSGEIIFSASGKEVSGIYASDKGTLRVIADTDTAVPEGSGNFSKFYHFSVLPGGAVSFKAEDKNAKSGIYVSSGNRILPVADVNKELPVGTGVFKYFGSFEPGGGNDFYFFAEGYEGQIGIYEAKYRGK